MVTKTIQQCAIFHSELQKERRKKKQLNKFTILRVYLNTYGLKICFQKVILQVL